MKKVILVSGFVLFSALPLFASNVSSTAEISFLGIRVEFIIFALTLLGVAVFHKHTLPVALVGLLSVLIFKLIFDPSFPFMEHFFGQNSFLSQLIHKDMRQGEWPIVLNLLGLLLGFAVLAKHFELSHIPEIIPHYLPASWFGGFILLVFIFFLSSFLDNIAAAMIGGTIALVVFRHRVHLGYLAAIVAASNAGGAGSVLGDTTTTMMWIQGISPYNVLHAYIASGTALLIFGVIASRQQHSHQPISSVKTEHKIKWKHLTVVILILIGAILTNIFFDFPAMGVWIALLIGSLFTHTPWKEAKHAVPGTVFLLSLVMSAGLMPVSELPDPSWHSTFGLGFISAVFDNIPLTKLALDQGGYNWGMLAYTVGFGGSMIWFGSSAGVAISNKFPQAKSVVQWIKNGWHVALAYVIGFGVLMIFV